MATDLGTLPTPRYESSWRINVISVGSRLLSGIILEVYGVNIVLRLIALQPPLTFQAIEDADSLESPLSDASG